MSGLVSAQIVERTNWSPGLMSITLSVSAVFNPGQFVNLGLKLGDSVVRRSYSVASAPGAPLELIISRVTDGALTPALFDLSVGSEVLVDPHALGFFTLAEVPETKRLWLVATGTGLGPSLSMLRAGVLWTRFEQVVVVHGVRNQDQLAYRDELLSACTAQPSLRYIPVLSSGVASGGQASLPSPARITSAWDQGWLESLAGPFDQDCHMLLCGNPQMIEDMSDRLKARGFEKHRRRTPGHFNFEKYWQ